jgi:hypothetical protein
MKRFVSNHEDKFALAHIEPLVLIMMNMQWGAASADTGRIEDAIATIGILARYLALKAPVGDLQRSAAAVLAGVDLHRFEGPPAGIARYGRLLEHRNILAKYRFGLADNGA